MKAEAIMVTPKDNVETVVHGAKAGEEVHYIKGAELCSVITTEDIPPCHKIAVAPIAKGAHIIKYGEIIGGAQVDIPVGSWVSHLNIESLPRDYGSELSKEGEREGTYMNFMGYKRPDGSVGIRNHVLILPGCACASETCRVVASQVSGAVNIINNSGCAEVKGNEDMTQKILVGFAANPNVYGVVVIGLGCENVSHSQLRESILKVTNKPVVSFGIQEEGGTLKTIEKAVRVARQMVADASRVTREPCDISNLMLGIECGGSDATSGFGANPAVGNLSDRLVDLGASTMMSETIEFVGAEHILARRGATKEIHDQIIQICRDYEAHLAAAGQDCRHGQPTPGNKEGGLSTIEEKSLGCIYKGGTRPIVEVVMEGERPTKKGAIVMDSPGYDIASVTAMVAGGCQVVVFTTGRGTPTGHALAPVLKVTANRATYQNMIDNMDIDASGVTEGEVSIEEAGASMLDEVLEVCNGKTTKAESYGFSDIAIDRICRFI